MATGTVLFELSRMDEHAAHRLGEPDLRVAGFQLWVHGYEFPGSTDSWDGNWLRVTAHCGAAGASVWVSGALLDTVSIVRFRRELAALFEPLGGEAVLQSHEPNIAVHVTTANQAGHLAVRAELTPDQLAQRHTFHFRIDQTMIAPVLVACEAILARLPVRCPSERGI